MEAYDYDTKDAIVVYRTWLVAVEPVLELEVSYPASGKIAGVRTAAYSHDWPGKEAGIAAGKLASCFPGMRKPVKPDGISAGNRAACSPDIRTQKPDVAAETEAYELAFVEQPDEVDSTAEKQVEGLMTA